MKSKYNGIKFDSELEVDYYKDLVDRQNRHEIEKFFYHPIPLKTIFGKYTPDFIYQDSKSIYIIETKGYNQFSFKSDAMIHKYMLSLSSEELKKYVMDINAVNGFNGDTTFDIIDRECKYQKIKYSRRLKAFVDWKYKDPTMLDKLREKNKALEEENKELKKFKKDTLRFHKYYFYTKKLTPKQKIFESEYLENLKTMVLK